METCNRRSFVAAEVECNELAELLLRVADGDREAFTAFYNRTARRVYGLTRKVLVNAELSRETTQEIFLMVWLDAHKYRPVTGSPMAWLMTITHRRAVDRVRSEQRGINREARWSAASQITAYDEVAEEVTDRIEAQNLHHCMKALSPLQREAITLAYYNCLTYREVAEKLAVPLPTVKSRIRDGLKQLKANLNTV